MKNKREIKGVNSEFEGEKFTGKKISKIIKIITAVCLSVGIVIGARQAIELYNQYAEHGNLDNLDSIVQQEDKIKEQSVELIKEAKEYIVRELGYDSEKVTVVLGRDGWYLVEKGEVPLYTNLGTISNGAKVRGEDGKTVQIPKELTAALDEMSKELNLGNEEAVKKSYEKLVGDHESSQGDKGDESIEKIDSFETMKEAKEYIVRKLGYDPEKVTVVLGRDGWYLVEKGEVPLYTNLGTISNGAKVRGEDGETVQIPDKYKEILDKMSKELNVGDRNEGK